MNIVEKKLENARMELQIEVPENQVELEFKSVFSKLQKGAKVSGFRKGKVPLELVTTRYKDIADQEVAENLLKAKYIDAINEKSLSPISMPEFDFDKIERGKSLTFTVRFDISPTVDLGKYTGFEAEEPACKIKDEDINNEIQTLRERNATISKKEEGEAIENGDFARIKIKRIDNLEKSEIENVEFKEYPLIVGKDNNDYSLDKHIVGMKLNEEKEVDVKYPKDFEAKDIAGQKVKYQVKAFEINRMKLPELDDEFVKDLGEYSTLEELKNKLREDFENFVVEKSKSKAKSELLKKAVEDSKFDLPDSMIRNQMGVVLRRIQNNMGTSEIEDIEELISYIETNNTELYDNVRKEAIFSIQSNLVLSEISKKEELKVSDERFKEAIEEIAKRNNTSVEEVEKIASEGNARENIESELILSSAIDLIYEKAKIKKQKPIPYSEFVKL